jgi:hypothetical protein
MQASAHTQGHLLANLLHFGRLLRAAGIPVGSRQVYELAEALTHLDLAQRDDVYHAARGFLVHRADELELFDQAFDLFWSRQVQITLEVGVSRRARPAADRQDQPPDSDQAILGGARAAAPVQDDEGDSAEETRLSSTYSPLEILYQDIAGFSEEELETAKRFIRSLVWQLDERLTRRQVRAAKRADSLDLRRALRRNMKYSGEILKLAWRRRKSKPRPLVVICDISGSMERYSRLFLHFIYALVQETHQVETFVFGTRLTRVTPALRHDDVDAALRKMSELVVDWSGGTRIGESLKAFNYRWSRRVLGRGAVAVVISDGWDRGDVALLEREMGRLQRSVSRLIWLNPLLGDPDYQPLVRGMQAALPYVDDFLPLHNLASFEQLAERLGSLR